MSAEDPSRSRRASCLLAHAISTSLRLQYRPRWHQPSVVFETTLRRRGRRSRRKPTPRPLMRHRPGPDSFQPHVAGLASSNAAAPLLAWLCRAPAARDRSWVRPRLPQKPRGVRMDTPLVLHCNPWAVDLRTAKFLPRHRSREKHGLATIFHHFSTGPC
jgi:hypothetical protein